MQNFLLSLKETRIEPTSPKIYYGCFYLGPFENGQALTVANALRRTLLSEISGLSITSAKVQNAFHEYASLEGVRETVLDILLNLKEIVLTKQNNNVDQSPKSLKPQIGFLQAQGPGIVRAADLKLPPLIECVDPEQYIATLTEDGTLRLKFRIEEGKNFREPKNLWETEKNIPEKTIFKTPPFLLIDSVFTPIKKVNYTIESYGSESLEKSNQIVILEVWTNGGVLPKEAVSQALNYLRMLFNSLGRLKLFDSLVTSYHFQENKDFRKTLEKFDSSLNLLNFESTQHTFSTDSEESVLNKWSLHLSQKSLTSSDKKQRNQKIEEWKNRDLQELGLPFRISECFYKSNIHKVGQLLGLSLQQLRDLDGLKTRSLSILKERLKEKGLVFEHDS